MKRLSLVLTLIGVVLVLLGTIVGIIGESPLTDLTPTVIVTEVETSTATNSGTLPATVAVTSSNTPTKIATTAVTLTPTMLPTAIPTSAATALPQRDCNRTGYNVNVGGLQDRTALENHTNVSEPCTMLFMDGGGVAWDYKLRHREAVVVVRRYSSYEGGQCLLESGQAQVDRFIAESANYPGQTATFRAQHNLVLYGCSNEPSWGGNNTLTQILNAEIVFMKYARSKGVMVCSGNFGVGNFQAEHVDAGLYDDYLRELLAGGHYLCVHEYTSLWLGNGTGYFSRNQMLDPYYAQPARWPTLDMLQMARMPFQATAFTVEDNFDDVPAGIEALIPYYSLFNTEFSAQAAAGTMPHYWHILRVYWLLIRARELGLAPIYVIITECCWDNLSDINRENPPALDMLASQWGITRFNKNLRGAPSHCRLWEEFYYKDLGWSCDEAAFQQLLWLDAVANEQIIGWHIFTWSWNPMWESFDVSTRQWSMNVAAFHQRLEQCQLTGCTFNWN